MRYILPIIILILSHSACYSQEVPQLPSFREILERLDKSDEFNFRALDVIREELSKARYDRERFNTQLSELRSLVSGLAELPERVLEAVGPVESFRKELEARTRPLASILESLSARFDSQAAEAERRSRGILEAFSEARTELIKARAEAQKQYAEAEKMRVEAQKELLEARGTLGSRLFWFSVCITGSVVVLLIGVAIIIAVISRLASKITAVLSLAKIV